MKSYLELVAKVLDEGTVRGDRTGTGTISIFGPQITFDLREGFPAVTTKRLALRLVLTELLWIVKGGTNIKELVEQKNHIWNEWPFKKWVEAMELDVDLSDPESYNYKTAMLLFKQSILESPEFAEKWGDLGPVYGAQWRHWNKARIETTTLLADDEHYMVTNQIVNDWVDQLQNAIDTIKNNPEDRRILVTAWNPGELDEMALPPCHLLYQLYVDGEYLDIKVFQRSADVFLGLPFDIASYAALLKMIAHVTGKVARKLIYTLGDTHIYMNHLDQMQEQLRREPYRLPTLNVNNRNRTISTIDDFELEDFMLEGYEHHPAIKGPVSI